MKRLAALLFLFAFTAQASPVAKATFAGGCFWCMEPPFEKLDGVISVVSGYTGGTLANPTYNQVSWGGTGHLESVEVTYDPKKITYGELIDVFWRNVDPTDDTGQFCDRGEPYLTAIFWHDEEQRRIAEISVRNVRRKFGRIATRVLAATRFWRAEEYHQDYYRKNPIRYRFYRAGCGRDKRLRELWR